MYYTRKIVTLHTTCCQFLLSLYHNEVDVIKLNELEAGSRTQAINFDDANKSKDPGK